jgi:hypothetical protein
VDALGDQVDERGRTRLAGTETDRGTGPKGTLAWSASAVGEVEFDLVARDVEQFGACLCVVAAEIGSTHALIVSDRTHACRRVAPAPAWSAATLPIIRRIRGAGASW